MFETNTILELLRRIELNRQATYLLKLENETLRLENSILKGNSIYEHIIAPLVRSI